MDVLLFVGQWSTVAGAITIGAFLYRRYSERNARRVYAAYHHWVRTGKAD